jgi:hypothetical protein
MDPELPSTVFPDLSRQDSSDRVSCTAHSLVNAVRLAGGNVPAVEVDRLKTVIIDNKKPLDGQAVQDFAQLHSLKSENLFHYLQTEIPRPYTAEGVYSGIVSKLTTGPMIMSIASELSLRDRSVIPRIEFDGKKADSHAVVAHLNNGTISIIDPYDPSAPRIIETDDPNQRMKFVALLTSPRARRTLVETDTAFNGNDILEEAYKKVADPNASPRYLAEALSFIGPVIIHNKQ